MQPHFLLRMSSEFAAEQLLQYALPCLQADDGAVQQYAYDAAQEQACRGTGQADAAI